VQIKRGRVSHSVAQSTCLDLYNDNFEENYTTVVRGRMRVIGLTISILHVNCQHSYDLL